MKELACGAKHLMLEIAELYISLSSDDDDFLTRMEQSLAAFIVAQPERSHSPIAHINLSLQRLSEQESEENRCIWHRSGELIHAKINGRYEGRIDLAKRNASFLVNNAPDKALDDIVINVIRLVFLSFCWEYNRFGIHSSALIYQDRAALFAGVSGIGKTTLAELFPKLAATQELSIIGWHNEDARGIPIQVYLWDSLFDSYGAHHLSFTMVPLNKIYFLKRTVSLENNPISRARAVQRLIRDSVGILERTPLVQKYASLLDCPAMEVREFGYNLSDAQSDQGKLRVLQSTFGACIE